VNEKVVGEIGLCYHALLRVSDGLWCRIRTGEELDSVRNYVIELPSEDNVILAGLLDSHSLLACARTLQRLQAERKLHAFQNIRLSRRCVYAICGSVSWWTS